MAEDGVPEVLQADRLGHIVPGIRGVYTHVSDTMRDDLKAKLQRRWETALDEGHREQRDHRLAEKCLVIGGSDDHRVSGDPHHL